MQVVSSLADSPTTEIVKGISAALAIGGSKQCDGCIGFHVQALIKLGVKRAELMEALGIAVYMGGGPALMYAADAVRAFEELS